MNPQVVTAVVASGVSFVVGLSAHLASRRALITTTQKLERELQRRLTEKLIDLRLDRYPQAFQITDRLLGEHIFGKHMTSTELATVREQLAEWNASKSCFLLSVRSLQSYYKLREALSLANTKQELSGNDLEEIWHAKNSFRKNLRADLRLIYSEEELSQKDLRSRKSTAP
jgi:hypothetical protein